MAEARLEAEELAERGGRLAQRGDFDRAVPALENALRELRGADSEMESRTCGNLGSIYASRGRQFEAVLLWRHGLDIAESQGFSLLAARHRANLAAVYAALELWDVLRAHLAECDAHVSDLDEAQRRQAGELFLWPRVYLALEDGDAEAARTLFHEFQAAYAGHGDPSSVALALVMKADVQRAQGKTDAALATLAAAERVAGLPPPDRVYVFGRTIEHLVAAQRIGEARRLGMDALEEIEAAAPDELLGDVSVAMAADLGRLLQGASDGGIAARRAFDVAASIALGRIAALDRAAERLPELCALPERDKAWIAELRAAYRGDQKELLRHVADLLDDVRNAPALFAESEPGAAWLLRICAWCGRVRTRDGRWLPLAHYLPGEDRDRVSHCLCQSCQETAFGPEA